MKVKVISLPYIFQVLYVLCFTRPRYQVSVYRTIGLLVFRMEQKEMIEGIANAPEECKQMLEEEAGLPSSSDPTFSELHELVNTCNSSIDGRYDVNMHACK